MIESTTHKAEVVNNVLKVWGKESDILVTTTFVDGEERVEKKPSPFPKVPLFMATYEGDGYCDVDCDVGFQRWHGSKLLGEVGIALRKCGFDSNQVIILMQKMIEVEQDCPKDLVK